MMGGVLKDGHESLGAMRSEQCVLPAITAWEEIDGDLGMDGSSAQTTLVHILHQYGVLDYGWY